MDGARFEPIASASKPAKEQGKESTNKDLQKILKTVKETIDSTEEPNSSKMKVELEEKRKTKTVTLKEATDNRPKEFIELENEYNRDRVNSAVILAKNGQIEEFKDTVSNFENDEINVLKDSLMDESYCSDSLSESLNCLSAVGVLESMSEPMAPNAPSFSISPQYNEIDDDEIDGDKMYEKIY